MANSNRPFGLQPVAYLNGSPWNGQARMYCILAADTSAYAIGDPVAMAVTATVGANADARGVPAVQLATAGVGNGVLGAIVASAGAVYGGSGVIPGSLETTVLPATKTGNRYILVADDPNIVFAVQEGGAGTALTQGAIWNNYDLLAGTNSGYQSGWQMDNASAGAGATVQLKLIGLQQTADNAFGAYAKWLCTINNHQLRAGTAGVA